MCAYVWGGGGEDANSSEYTKPSNRNTHLNTTVSTARAIYNIYIYVAACVQSTSCMRPRDHLVACVLYVCGQIQLRTLSYIHPVLIGAVHTYVSCMPAALEVYRDAQSLRRTHACTVTVNLVHSWSKDPNHFTSIVHEHFYIETLQRKQIVICNYSTSSKKLQNQL